jgi:uncharacterized protein
MATAEQPDRPLTWYVILTYLAVLANAAFYFDEMPPHGILPTLHQLAVLGTYSFLYMLPVVLLLVLIGGVIRIGPVARLLRAVRVGPRPAVFVPAVLCFTGLQLLIWGDRYLFKLYGFHINGFVVNLVLTPGGIESLDSTESTKGSFLLILGGFLALQTALLFVALRLGRARGRMRRLVARRGVVTMLVVFAIFTAGERVAFGVAGLRACAPVLVGAETFPFYQPLSIRNLAGKFGIEAVERESVDVGDVPLSLKYPREPLRWSADGKRYNIVWLVAESLRADMLTPKIMPATHEFSTRAANFENHISGGHSTRMGIFTMFYGLYGPYWFRVLPERRPPVLMDLLIADDYELGLYTSAKFTYPEFDQTVFAGVPTEQLHSDSGATDTGWVRDRRNVAEVLKFLDAQTAARPFMTFMFFESPHAPYFFPPETEIRKPYLEDLNYATMDLENDIGLIWNRYANSCRHLDTQIAPILEKLEAKGLLDETIVIITGDHGEEFMEHGRWGHNSDFTREQIHVPLIIRMPGRPPETVTRLTSHLDLPATVLTALGVENPPEDYSLGYDLFGPVTRDFAATASWSKIVYTDLEYTAVFPMKGGGFLNQVVMTADGEPLEDSQEFFLNRREQVMRMMKGLKAFSR